MATAVATTVVCGVAAAAAPRADLTVAKLGRPPATIAPGGKFALSSTTRNAGPARARASTTVFLLSADAKRDPKDVVLGRLAVKALAARRTLTRAVTLRVPARTRAGRYRVFACADGSRKVRERREGNNCRVSRAALRVTAPAKPGGGTGSAPGSPAAGGAPPGTTPPPGAPSTPPADGTGAPIVSDGVFPQAPHPMSVGETADGDPAHAGAKTIGEGGGTITAHGPDGTTYTLKIPAQALLSDTDITMTPITSITGTSLDSGFLGGVQLKPEGLQLMTPATLAIQPAGSAPTDQQTAFDAFAGGADFHLIGLLPTSTPTIPLTHFSSVGLSAVGDVARAAVLAHPPADRRAQLEQAMAESLRQGRLDQLTNPGAAFPDQAISLMASYYKDIVHPLVEQALTDDTVADDALSELFAWAHQVESLGVQDDPRLEAFDAAVGTDAARILDNAIHRNYARCVGHDLDAIARMMRYARLGLILGVDNDGLQLALACGHFTVHMDSRIEQHGTTQVGYNTTTTNAIWEAKADVPVDLFGAGFGPLTWVQYSFASEMDQPCSNGTLVETTTGTGTTPGTAVMSLGLDLNFHGDSAPVAPDRGARLTIGVDGIGERQHEHIAACDGSVQDFDLSPADFSDHFRNDFHVGDPAITGFTPGAGDGTIATKDLTATSGDLKETTKITIVHTPQ